MPQSQHCSHPNRCKIPAILLIALFLLSACSTPTARPATESPAIQASPVELPTAPESTPTDPPVISKVVLVAGQADANAQALQTALQELAAQNGAAFETRASLAPGDVQPGWQVVVLAAPQDNLAEIAGAAADTQFVVVSQGDLQVPGNVSVIRARKEYEAFTAGFISVLISNDWRAAGLLPSDTGLGGTIDDAFRNGGAYFCGRCLPLLAPYVRFPIPVSLPTGSSLADWQSAANTLGQSVVYTLYVDGQVSSPELQYDLGSSGFILFGGQTPADEVRPRWALTLQTDVVSPLKELWPGLVKGEGGKVVNAGITFADVDPTIFTPGKQQLTEQMLGELTKGYINPFNP